MSYIPFPLYYDDAPIDLRFVYKDEKPAGKRGFVRCVDDHFEFEDGTLARFWGVNFNGGSCFPEKKDAEKIALRLAKYGVNMVRYHQLDAVRRILDATENSPVGRRGDLPRGDWRECRERVVHGLAA